MMMEQKYYWNDYAVEHGARAAFISEETEKTLNEYVECGDVSILEKITNARVAHVMDVIFKESVRTVSEDDPWQGKESFTTCFETPYYLFDKDKVFFSGDNHCSKWSFPITVVKEEGEENCSLKTNFSTHNFFYPNYAPMLNDFEGLVDCFYQDIDIFGNEKTWKYDLIKALYRVVLALYWWWEEELRHSLK